MVSEDKSESTPTNFNRVSDNGLDGVNQKLYNERKTSMVTEQPFNLETNEMKQTTSNEKKTLQKSNTMQVPRGIFKSK